MAFDSGLSRGKFMHVARLVRRTGLAVALAGGVALAGMAAPAFADPPGNNGTIKIDNVAFDSHPNNEPHVGCTFQVDFYGYDVGDLDATVIFRVWPPTGNREILLRDEVAIGEDDNSGGGSEAGLDASETYDLDLSGYEPGPKGFHVKLTIHAEGSQGADVKHKVFWVEECKPEPSPTPTEPTKEPTDKPTDEPDDEETEKPEPVPTAVPAGTDSSGGGSGAGLLGLALTASGAVAGTAVLVRRRFLHDS
jgi:hypothetical protein